MSAAHTIAGSSTGLPQDTTLPLQPISASHHANHRANAATGSEEKSGLPMPGNASAGEPSTAIPEPPSENASPDVAETSVEMSDTALQRCPNAIDGRTSRAGQHWADDLGAGPCSRGVVPQYTHIFDAEDDRIMVTKYINTVSDGKVWPSTRHCGRAPIVRRYNVESTLHEKLFNNLFASAVNDASTAMGGPACYWVTSIYLYEHASSGMGVRIAEVGDIHTLCNMQHFRALPYHNHDIDWLCEPPQALPPVDATGEVSVFEGDEEVATEFGDPQTEEGAGEFDETETF